MSDLILGSSGVFSYGVAAAVEGTLRVFVKKDAVCVLLLAAETDA